MLDKLALYLQYPYVRYAFIVGVLVALCSSLLGVTLVLKRFSFIGDGLSHVAFGAMTVATVLQLSNEMLLVLPLTILSAVLLLRTGQRARIKGDAAVAMISVAALAFGYLIMNLFSASSNLSGDVCSTLFGSTSILTLSKREVWLSVVLSVAVVIIFIAFYNKIFAVTFDEDFARATGTGADRWNLLIAVVVADRRRRGCDHRACHESGGLPAHLRPGHIPGPVRHAAVRQLQGGHGVLRGAFGGLRPSGHPDLRAGRNPGGLHHCRR